MDLRGAGDYRVLGIRGSWVLAAVAGLVATTLVGFTVLRPAAAGRLDVTLEPAGVAGEDPFLVLDSPELRIGQAQELALGGGVTVRVGTVPGLYGGSGSDHLCDPRLIADFLARDSAKASAWASAAGIEVDEIDTFLDTLTPVRLLADTWVTNHGYRDGRATPRSSILQAGTMVLVDDHGVPRVRCKCGNPLGPADPPSDLSTVDFIGEPWDGFDPEQLLVIERAAEAIEAFILVRLEDGRLIARPVGTVGDQDVLVDEDLNWIPELDLELPPEAAVGDGPFALPPASSAGIELAYGVSGPCRVQNGTLVLEGEGLCSVSVSSEAEGSWAALDLVFEIDVGRLDQDITLAEIDRIVLEEGPIVLGALADSMLPVSYVVSGPCAIDGDQLVPTGVGDCELVVSQVGDERWAPAEPLQITIEIVGDPPRTAVTLTFNLPVSLRLDGAPLRLDATTNPSRPVSYQATGACRIEGGTSLVATTAGPCTVVAVASDNDEFQRAVGQDTVTILPRRQTLGLEGLPRTAVLGPEVVPLPATTSAGFEIDYEVSGPCRRTIAGLVLTGTGTCELVASAAGDAETERISETVEITITPAPIVRQPQSITFARPDSLVFGGSGVTLSASASSGLAVTLTVIDGDCSLTGRTLTPGATGSCDVVASQIGDANYLPAESVTWTVGVAKRTPTISVVVTGGPVDEMVVGETRTIGVTVSSGPAAFIMGTSGPCTSSGAGTIVAVGTSAGQCTVTVGAAGDANHNPVSDSVSITVKLDQTVTVTVSPASIVVGGRASVKATASSGLAVTVSAGPASVCTLSNGVVVGVGAGTCNVSADQAGNGSYVGAGGSGSITVAALDDSIRFDCGSCTVRVGQQVGVIIVSESGLTPSASTEGSCAIANQRVDGSDLTVFIQSNGSGPCTLRASTSGDAKWNPASGSLAITVIHEIDLAPVIGSNFFVGDCGGTTCSHQVSFTVVNNGTGSSPPTTVTVLVTPNSAVTVGVPAIGAGQSTAISTTVNGIWCYDPDCYIEVTVDPGDQVGETNESNNFASWSDRG